MSSLKYVNFIKVKKENREYFGGNQSWWNTEDNAMCEYGCGVIALCNLELYLNGQAIKGIDYNDYKNYVEQRKQEAYFLKKGKLFQKMGLMPFVMERGLDDYFNEKNINPIISWAPTINKRRIRKLIEKMLKNNIPIVASYYVFNKKNKIDLYSYDKKKKCFELNSGMKRHYFNIVGLTRRNEIEYLVISTWGEKYYVVFNDWLRKLSIFSNILYVEIK